MRYRQAFFFVIVAAMGLAACGGHAQMPPTAATTSQGNSSAHTRHTKSVSPFFATPPPGLALNSCVQTPDPSVPNTWKCYVDYQTSVTVPNGGTVSFSASSGGCVVGCAPYFVVACQAYFAPQPPPDPQFPFPATLDFGSQTWSSTGGTIDGCIKKTVQFSFTVKAGSLPPKFSYSAGSFYAPFDGTVTRANGTVQQNVQFDGVQVYVYLPLWRKLPIPSPTSTPAPKPTPCAPGTPGPDPGKAIQLFDGNGMPITNFKGEQIFRPDDGHDPLFFINQGLLFRSSFSSPIMNLLPLPLFGQDFPWDEQRVNGVPYTTFVDYATIAIGLYAAASNTPEGEILLIENAYAQTSSHYRQGTPMDSTYTSLPKRNVYNTHLGYTLYKSNPLGLCFVS